MTHWGSFMPERPNSSCSIAGKTGCRWMAVGDSAQMINPGCSFSFSGMKQTLMKVSDDQLRLKKPERLEKNYRVSKGVLSAANSITELLKKHYPNVFGHLPPEVAMKDLGIDVVLVSFAKGTSHSAAFNDPSG